MGTRERLIELLDKALAKHGAEVEAEAGQGPAYLLWECSGHAAMARTHRDDETGDEEPVAPEMAALAALYALMAAVVVEEADKRKKALRGAG